MNHFFLIGTGVLASVMFVPMTIRMLFTDDGLAYQLLIFWIGTGAWIIFVISKVFVK